MLNFFNQKTPNQLEQFRQDYGIQMTNVDDVMSIQTVDGYHLQEFLLFCCKVTGYSENNGYYNSNALRQYLLGEHDSAIRNARFYGQIALVAAKLAKEPSQEMETLFSILVTLKEYLELHNQKQ